MAWSWNGVILFQRASLAHADLHSSVAIELEQFSLGCHKGTIFISWQIHRGGSVDTLFLRFYTLTSWILGQADFICEDRICLFSSIDVSIL